MLYWPLPSVVTERTFSINTELAASTVTPGSTAPDASLTIPAIVAASWARAPAGTKSTARTTRVLANLCMPPPAFPARTIISLGEIDFSERTGIYALGGRLSSVQGINPHGGVAE